MATLLMKPNQQNTQSPSADSNTVEEQQWNPEDVRRLVKVQKHWRRFVENRQQTYIRLFSFRGVRTIHNTNIKNVPDPESKNLVDQECQNEPLLYAGHVGVSADNGRHIYAWNPIIPASESLEVAMRKLKNGASYPGILSDDTHVFERAAMHHLRHGWNTAVSTVLIQVTPERMTEIREILADLHAQTNGEHGFKYSFPRRKPDGASKCGFFEDDQTSNCATFARIFLGLESCGARHSGRMFSFASRSFAASAMLDVMADSNSSSRKKNEEQQQEPQQE